MKRAELAGLAVSMALCVGSTACSGGKSNPAAEAPPPLKLEKVEDRNLFQVDQPERFQLTQATEHLASPELKVTGTVNPDISRAVPVISLATGRVVEIGARLGDTVKKGQVLLKVQSADISGAFSDYRKAKADEALAHTQLERAKLLYEKGAISQNDLQVTNAAGVPGLGSPNPFTISDLSYVWILCDVYENDLADVRLGDKADIRLNA